MSKAAPACQQPRGLPPRRMPSPRSWPWASAVTTPSICWTEPNNPPARSRQRMCWFERCSECARYADKSNAKHRYRERRLYQPTQAKSQRSSLHSSRRGSGAFPRLAVMALLFEGRCYEHFQIGGGLCTCLYKFCFNLIDRHSIEYPIPAQAPILPMQHEYSAAKRSRQSPKVVANFRKQRRAIHRRPPFDAGCYEQAAPAKDEPTTRIGRYLSRRKEHRALTRFPLLSRG